MSQSRHYETTYILHPDVDEARAKAIAERIEGIISDFNGEIIRVEEWGRRKLAYRVKQNTRGIYIYVRYTADPEAIAELERVMRLIDEVIKFLTLKVDLTFEQELKEAKEREAVRASSRASAGSDDDDDDDDDDDEDDDDDL